MASAWEREPDFRLADGSRRRGWLLWSAPPFLLVVRPVAGGFDYRVQFHDGFRKEKWPALGGESAYPTETEACAACVACAAACLRQWADRLSEARAPITER